MRKTTLVPLLLCVLAGCSAEPLGVEPDASPGPSLAGPSLAAASADADISGAWNWREVVVLNLNEFAATVFFGIQPEGPQTHVRCNDSGTMTLVQTGASFTGTALQTATCETQGGQVFTPPVFPPVVDIAEGSIRGRSMHFLFGAGDVPCPYRAEIADVQAGVAVRLTGGGKCITPGHPQSPLPFDPPGASSPTVIWEATRP
jgi:hypothetical protein